MENSSNRSKTGAALIESCLVIMMLCVILFGILQVAYLISARDVISFTAFAAARSATVGMEDEFVDRVVRTVSIPTAGPMLVPGSVITHATLGAGGPGDMWDRALANSPSSEQFWVENYLIPVYLGAEEEGMLDGILNYLNWVASDGRITSEIGRSNSSFVDVLVQQDVPLAFPFARAFFRKDMGQIIRKNESGNYVYREVPVYSIEQEFNMENHSALYLTNQ
ncbi:MAG: pilus assembly protein [Kiritimatiellales bacterium]|nr:pilus assembly protein [Kiritimatiellales bacterium]